MTKVHPHKKTILTKIHPHKKTLITKIYQITFKSTTEKKTIPWYDGSQVHTLANDLQPKY